MPKPVSITYTAWHRNKFLHQMKMKYHSSKPIKLQRKYINFYTLSFHYNCLLFNTISPLTLPVFIHSITYFSPFQWSFITCFNFYTSHCSYAKLLVYFLTKYSWLLHAFLKFFQHGLWHIALWFPCFLIAITYPFHLSHCDIPDFFS